MKRMTIKRLASISLILLVVYLAVRISFDFYIDDLRREAADAERFALATSQIAYAILERTTYVSNTARLIAQRSPVVHRAEYDEIQALRATLATLPDAEVVASWQRHLLPEMADDDFTAATLRDLPAENVSEAIAQVSTLAAFENRATEAGDSAILNDPEYLQALDRFFDFVTHFHDHVVGISRTRAFEAERTLEQVLFVTRLLSTLAVMYGIWLIWIVWTRGLRPLRTLVGQADRVSAGDFGARNDVVVDGTEFGKLAQVMNRMTETVQTEFGMLRDEAHTDTLTGLDNRRALERRLGGEIARAQRSGWTMCVAMLDLDHFKRVNDKYGHQAGDAILKAFADTVIANVREMDLVMRYGGEEFTVILLETDAETVRPRLERLREAVANMEVVHRDVALPPITVSIGFVEAPTQVDSADAALEAADKALYAAKKAGRNRVERYVVGE